MKKTKLEKGITLIALIITIVVLLILAVVTIGVIKDSKIITHAQNAANDYIIGGEKEQIELAYGEYKISKINNPSSDLQVKGASSVSGNATDGWTVEFETGNKYIISPTGEITKDELIVYDPERWKYAWTSDGTIWSDIIEKEKLEEGATVEGKIIAKIYETEESIDALSEDGLNIPAGKGYHLEIDATEENVEMPAIMIMENGNMKTSAWLKSFYDFATGVSTTDSVLPYITKIIIDDNITNIPDYAFMSAIKLADITIPNSITTLGKNIFQECRSLNKIVIPGGISVISEDAFHSAYLNEVIIENGVTVIGSYAFGYCKNLSKVVIPNSVTRIGDNAFEGCESLNTVIIPQSVVKIGSRAFYKCVNLKEVYIETNDAANFTVGTIAFDEIANNSTIYVRKADIADKILKNNVINTSNTTISTDYKWTAPTI